MRHLHKPHKCTLVIAGVLKLAWSVVMLLMMCRMIFLFVPPATALTSEIEECLNADKRDFRKLLYNLK